MSTKSKKRKPGSGRIHPPNAMFFRIHAGEAASGKRQYEMSTNVGGGVPIIHSKQTGKWFVLPWEDIITLAIKAGIDKP